MKSSSSIVSLALALLILFSTVPVASAQTPYTGGFNGGGIYEPGTFRSVAADVGSSLRWPGSVWVSANYADRGLGFRGSYLTAGLKTRLFEDFLDGRWLFEGRGHVSEEGGFFGNFGIERVFTVHAAGADVSVAAWFDYDDDQDSFAFADTLNAWGVTGQIKTQHWDLIANGYFPIGTSDSTQGDPTGGTPFFENRITLVPGIDSGLEGFDVTIRTRPSKLAFVNGTFDFGGYGYESDLVEFFGGGRIRTSFQLLRGLIVSGELNYDDRFDATGILGVTLLYGANPRGHEYSPLGKDLQRTARNDHIVRFNQDVVLAIDPDTGAAYNVIHVNNLADPGPADGTFERPFTNFADAEAASSPDDIIFVNDGDGTSRNYTGIALQEGQLLLGDGIGHPIPIGNGGIFGDTFVLADDLDGMLPRITGMNNGAAVTLDSRNTVRGFNIQGADAVGGMAFGIFGSAGMTNIDGIIERVTVRDARLNGIGITNLGGDWTFTGNDLQENQFNGISLVDACVPGSTFTFDSNIASNNLLEDGIQIINYDADSITFTNNTTDGNGRDGIRLEGFKGADPTGTDILIDNHTAQNNIGTGINVIDGVGNLTISNSIIGTEFDDAFFSSFVTPGAIPLPLTGNNGGGISIVDFETPGAQQVNIIDNDINSNGQGAGAGLRIEINEGVTDAFVSGNRIDLNGVGILGIADTVGLNPSTLNLNVIDNVSVGTLFFDPNISGAAFNTGNNLQGIRVATDGQAVANLVVDQTTGTNLLIFGNGMNGVDLLAQDESTLSALIREVTISSSGSDGVFGQTSGNGQLSLLVEDSIVGRDPNALIEMSGANPANGFINDGNVNGFNFNFDNDEGGRVNTVIVRNVRVADNLFNGFTMTTNAGTLTDVAIVDSVFDNPWLLGARTDGILIVDGGNPVGNPDRGFATGIVFNAIGDADQITNPQIDNRTRILFQGNTIDRYTLGGFQLNTSGDARVLAEFIGNSITNNGDGFDAGAQPDPPFFAGVEFNSIGRSAITSTFTGNDISGNAAAAFDVSTNGTSSVTSLFNGNNLSDSALFTVFDVVAINNDTSNMALSFSNNAIDNDALINLGNLFTLELNGFTNGINFANPFPAGLTPADFGDVVQPLIDAEEAAFSINFPPSPPSFP